MTRLYLFEAVADFCNVALGREKGQIEKNLQDRRRHIWWEASECRRGTWAGLYTCLAQTCIEPAT